MAATCFAVAVSVGTAFVAAATLGSHLVGRLDAVARRNRVLSGSANDAMRTPLFIRKGVFWALPAARVALKVPFVQRLFSNAVNVLYARGISVLPLELCSAWCAVLVGLVLVGTLVGASPVFGIAAAACFAIAGYFAIEHAQEERAERLREGVPDVLHSMGVCFHAGLSLMQTFQQIASESEGAMRELFSRNAHELETGASTEESLASFQERATIPELAFVAVALKVQHDAGGSMAAILEAARDSVQSEVELKRSLRVQTAQAKLSARVVTAMPFVLITVFSLITEDFLAPFFTSAIGLVLLVIALAMQVAGVMIVRSLLRVECE